LKLPILKSLTQPLNPNNKGETLVMMKGKVAVITGAGQGIGRAIALRLAREGVKVVIGDLDATTAQQTAQAINTVGGQAVYMVTDVTRKSDAAALIGKAVELFGCLDILVNNAGFYPSAPIIEIDENEWDRVLAVNLKSTFLCSQAAAKQMMTQKQGVIINIASVDAKTRTTGNAHYAAAKAGVISFTRTLACEMAPYKIRVNAVSPGWIATNSMKAASERWQQAVEKIPMGRLGTPEDVAEAVLFLASDVASYITGEILDVNGGEVMD
jgi:3-oxoacyl-[acyl-carrier protein] reductase